ncbi:MAG: alpha/beta hydrolase [Candidatus Eremiobacteraeota bacterium]|nr:alpha/beta hydrolase [Candidatus Eremiobacteraeota bacterium]
MSQLLYVHGSGYTEESFRAQVAAFPGSDALSLPGHPAGRALGSVAECAAWLARYVEWKRVDRAVVAGNSLGGAIALRWALDHPDQVAGLVLIGTGARLRVSAEIFRMLDEDWPACIDSLVDWALAPGAPDELRQSAKSWHLLVGRDSTRTDYSVCNEFDVIDRLGELQIPVLVVVGEHDEMTPPKYSTFLHERIAGSTLEIISGAGHVVMAEKPVETNAAIATFLSALA